MESINVVAGRYVCFVGACKRREVDGWMNLLTTLEREPPQYDPYPKPFR